MKNEKYVHMKILINVNKCLYKPKKNISIILICLNVLIDSKQYFIFSCKELLLWYPYYFCQAKVQNDWELCAGKKNLFPKERYTFLKIK